MRFLNADNPLAADQDSTNLNMRNSNDLVNATNSFINHEMLNPIICSDGANQNTRKYPFSTKYV